MVLPPVSSMTFQSTEAFLKFLILFCCAFIGAWAQLGHEVLMILHHLLVCGPVGRENSLEPQRWSQMLHSVVSA